MTSADARTRRPNTIFSFLMLLSEPLATECGRAESTRQFDLGQSRTLCGARERAHRKFDRDTTHAGDAWYRPSMRSIRGEISHKTAARCCVLETPRRERRAPRHIFSERWPRASDLCCEANAVTCGRVPNDVAARRELPERGTGLSGTPDSTSALRSTVRRTRVMVAPRQRQGREAAPYGRALESCGASSGSGDPQSFASESGRRRSRTNSAPISLDAGRSR